MFLTLILFRLKTYASLKRPKCINVMDHLLTKPVLFSCKNELQFQVSRTRPNLQIRAEIAGRLKELSYFHLKLIGAA